MALMHEVPYTDRKDAECANCSACDKDAPKPLNPFLLPRYWIASFVIQGSIFLLGVLLFNASRRSSPSPSLHLGDNKEPFKFGVNAQNSESLVGTYSSPINAKIPHKIESTSADYWKTDLYFGEPTYASDYAWNNLTTPRLFRLHPNEAPRLKFEDSVRIEPGEDYATILGVIHNLHCLRRIRQMLYSDYYYPDAEQDELDYNKAHSLHCLEAIRSSILCYPDLNPHPYYWSGNPYHDITVSGKVTRQCVDWEALGDILEARNFDAEDLMHGTGPSH